MMAVVPHRSLLAVICEPQLSRDSSPLHVASLSLPYYAFTQYERDRDVHDDHGLALALLQSGRQPVPRARE